MNAPKDTELFPPALMRTPEAARYLAVSPRFIAVLQRRKTIPCVKIGAKCTRFRRADLDRFIQERAS